MTNSDRNEIRRRFVKENSISRLALCYVNSSKEKVVVQNEVFLSLPEADMFKYLDIVKKSLSGNIGDNLLELSYNSKQEEEEKYRFLTELRSGELKKEELTEKLFDGIIENYAYPGNYLITVIYDCYDVPVKTTDKRKLDESEDVFSYIIVSICPVNQTKAGLGYLPQENRIGAREMDWVAGPPDAAFMFPSFSDRSADIHKVVFYSRDTSVIHDELIDSVLGCSIKKTATQCREVLKEAVNDVVGAENKDKARDTLLEIHDSINCILDEYAAEEKDISERVLDRSILSEAVKDVIENETEAEKIVKSCEEKFNNEPPKAELFVDKKALKSTEVERREKELRREIADLKDKLKKADDGRNPDENYDEISDEKTETADTVSVIIPSERRDSIRFEEIDGNRYLLIPLTDEEEPDIKTT